MNEIFRLLFHLLFRKFGPFGDIFRWRFQRLHLERYSGDESRVSRFTEGEKVYLAIRTPYISEKRFSLMFPQSTSRLSRFYLAICGAAKWFVDDRGGLNRSSASGYFLPWSDAAQRDTEGADLFARLWTFANDLPASLQEVHSDGSHLRAIFVLDRIHSASFNTSATERKLDALAQTISPKAPPRKRPWYGFIFWIANYVGWLVALFTGILLVPDLDFVDSTPYFEVVLAVAAFWAVVLCIWGWYVKRTGMVRFIISASLMATLYSMAALLQLNQRFDNHPVMSETWYLTKVTFSPNKLNPSRSEVVVMMGLEKGVFNRIRLKGAKYLDWDLQQGMPVSVVRRKGLFGLDWIEQAKVSTSQGEINLVTN